MSMRERYFVYLRRHNLASATPELLAEGAGLCRADANRVLRGKLPQSIAVCDDPDQARERITNLRACGLDGIAVTPGALRNFAPRLLVSGLRQRDGILWCGDGGALKVSGVRMLVLGKILKSSETTTTTEIDPVYPGTLGFAFMAGQIAATGVAYHSKMHSDEAYCVLFRSAGEAYLILDGSFQFKSLLQTLSPTREQTFLALSRELRAAYPDAIFDDALFRFPPEVDVFQREDRITSGMVSRTTRSVREGDTQQRTFCLAYLLYLQAFGL
jgi:hypothetical protein